VNLVCSILFGIIGNRMPGSLGYVFVYIAGLFGGGVFLVLWHSYREHKWYESERLTDERIRNLERSLDNLERGKQ
jgi:hypothetical protein